jgi:hypothetical protein
MPAPARSFIPLWLTLGFSAGLAFGWMAFHEETKLPPPASPPLPGARDAIAPDRVEIPVDAGTLRAVEQMFNRWGGYAVWENDVTEIAAWDPRRKRHSDFYEVRRHEGKFYFRSLRTLTRPIIDHGVSTTMPVAFTEPQEAREKFYREHPDYDPASAPRIDLPPKPPERWSPTRGGAPSSRSLPSGSNSNSDRRLDPGSGN